MTYDQSASAMTMVAIGEMRLNFEKTADGIILLSLMDTITGSELLSSQLLPLFTLKMRNIKTAEETALNSSSGWKSTHIDKKEDFILLRWENPDIEKIKVDLHGKLDDINNAIYWNMNIENGNPDWSIMSVVFPQVGIADLGADGCVFFPRGPGEVQKALWNRPFRHHGLYPEPWTVMQFVSAYNQKTGIYVATHDPNASTKEITIESRTDEQSVVFTFENFAEDMTKGGNDFTLSGHAVWRLLRGDWFDSAMIYKDWLSKEARWYPDLNADGRDDTPEWMKELCVWATTGGNAENVVPRVKKFAEYMGVPVGFHWYNWHQIPFDNDYPHYFPVTDGFADGVEKLKEAGVYVMPYINGRLWDTKDKGAEDYQFTSVAKPASTKDENGDPYIESYGSKESDDTPVRFAVMCPTTELWQKKIHDICMRLFDEYKVNSVYIDQISAMSPKLCMDKTHNHPLGGGYWWVDGYWDMLKSIRDEMPKGAMLTSECNAEPYAKWLDGYLSWTWQHDGQVPAFPAVYASAIQNFGRAYRGGTTSDLALKMKAGQQLVFGEQIGWIDPGVIDQKENGEFLRQVVRLRWHLRRYFYVGEMLRPPKLIGDIPEVRADWQWAGEWWVTTPSVLTGAWKLPQDNKIVLICVNVSDKPVSAKLEINLAEYGVDMGKSKIASIDENGLSNKFVDPSVLDSEIVFPAHSALAWEVSVIIKK
jgi:hypothetical protein